MTAAHERMYRYRRLFPMSYEQYLDEPGEVVEWALRIAELRGDRPWQQPRKEPPRADDRSA